MQSDFPMSDFSGLQEGAGMFAIMMMVGFALLIGIAISCVICFIISSCFKRIPQQFREMEPGMVWLLLIPCFGIIWNFFVWIKLSKSYQAYFQSEGVTDVGDCGYNLNLAFCIVAACQSSPA